MPNHRWNGKPYITFFQLYCCNENSLAEGRQIIAYGEIRRGNLGAEIIHPEYKVKQENDLIHLQETLTPVYPTTDGLRQTTLRKLLEQALTLIDTENIAELLPEELRQGLISLPEAIKLLHSPPPDIELSELDAGRHPAQKD